MKITPKQKTILLNSISFATIPQTARILLWNLFYPKKFKNLMDHLEKGRSFSAAYFITKIDYKE